MTAALTNFPQYMDDICDQGNLATINVYQSWNFIISQPILTSQFTVTPTQPVGYLWLLSSPVSIALGSFLIHSIQIIDNSLPLLRKSALTVILTGFVMQAQAVQDGKVIIHSDTPA